MDKYKALKREAETLLFLLSYDLNMTNSRCDPDDDEPLSVIAAVYEQRISDAKRHIKQFERKMEEIKEKT